MKEFKVFSKLLDEYISTLTMKMENKKKNINIYDMWENIVEEENLPSNSYLDDFKNGSIVIHVEHPGIAQQIRMKSKDIMQKFKNEFPNLNIRKLNIIIDSVFN